MILISLFFRLSVLVMSIKIVKNIDYLKHKYNQFVKGQKFEMKSELETPEDILGFEKFGSIPEFVVCGPKANKILIARLTDYDNHTKMIPFKKNQKIKQLYKKYENKFGHKYIFTFYFNHPYYKNVPIPSSVNIQSLLLRNTNKTILTVKKGIPAELYYFQIYISYAEKDILVQVNNTFTVKQLKMILQKEIELSIEKMELKYQTNQLNDDSQTLEDLELTLNSSVKVSRKKRNLQSYNSVKDTFFIIVRMPDNREIKFKVNQFDLVQSLKENIYLEEKIPIIQQHLMFDKQPLDNKDMLIYYKQEKLLLSIKQSGGCFKFNAQVLVPSDEGSKNEKYQAIEKLKKGDQILFYNCTSEKLEVEVISFVVHEQIKSGVKIIFDDNRTIECTPNHYFLTSDGKWQNCQYDRPGVEILHPGSQLQSIAGKTQLVKDIQYFESNEPVDFYHLSLNLNHTFVVNGIITHNMQIFVQSINGQKFPIDIMPSDLIKNLKKYIEDKIHIIKDNQKLIFAGLELKDQSSLSDYNIQKGSAITLLDRSQKMKLISVSENFGFVINPNQNYISIKQINFIISKHQSVKISYIDVKTMTAEQFINAFAPDSSAYSRILYGDILLHPKQKIRIIQSFQIYHENIDIILIPTGQKIVFSAMFTEDSIVESTLSTHVAQEKRYKQIQKKIQAQKLPRQTISIALYTSNLHYKGLNQILRKLQPDNKEIQRDQKLNLCCGVINALKKLPDFIGEVHRGIHDFKISQSWGQKQDCICFPNFVSCSREQKVAINFLNKKGSLLHIKSLTGKYIKQYSLHVNQDQIIFAPYAYFVIEKVIDYGEYEEIWMTEMPSPQTFKKDIIVWVDDIPKNNLGYIQKLKLKDEFEVLPLVSTKMAQIWLRQFGWVLNMKNIKYKIISDMVRIQDNRENYYAGIDLIQLLYNNWGITPKVLIFCGNTQKGTQNAINRNINGYRQYQINNSLDSLIQFVGQNWSQQKIKGYIKIIKDDMLAQKEKQKKPQKISIPKTINMLYFLIHLYT